MPWSSHFILLFSDKTNGMFEMTKLRNWKLKSRSCFKIFCIFFKGKSVRTKTQKIVLCRNWRHWKPILRNLFIVLISHFLDQVFVVISASRMMWIKFKTRATNKEISTQNVYSRIVVFDNCSHVITIFMIKDFTADFSVRSCVNGESYCDLSECIVGFYFLLMTHDLNY